MLRKKYLMFFGISGLPEAEINRRLDSLNLIVDRMQTEYFDYKSALVESGLGKNYIFYNPLNGEKIITPILKEGVLDAIRDISKAKGSLDIFKKFLYGRGLTDLELLGVMDVGISPQKIQAKSKQIQLFAHFVLILKPSKTHLFL